MNDFTPAVDYAREMYADNRYHRHDEDYAEALAQFDRMLAEHDRAIAEKAWEEGAQAMLDEAIGPSDEALNPYKPLSVSTPKDADT